MKKIILLLLALGIIFGVGYLITTPKPDETKTTDETEELAPDNSLTSIDQELSATEIQDFDQEIQALDESINQL